jgi:polysaccharide biosynthesis protein PslG
MARQGGGSVVGGKRRFAVRQRAGMLLAALVLLSGMLPLFTPDSTRAATTPTATETAPRFFPETSHYVSGRFREFWEANGGLFVFGLPLTKEFEFPSTDGKIYTVQYFERAIFEKHPENPYPYDVLLTHLARELITTRGNEAPFKPAPKSSDPQQTYFPETQHNVGPIFMSYWRRFGGLQVFGYPLSELFTERNQADGKDYLVLYFERARFEYHPENAGTDYVVEIGHLGRERMLRVGVPLSAQAPETSPPVGTKPGPFVPIESSGPTLYPLLKAPNVALGIQAQWYGQPMDRLAGMVHDIGFKWTKQQVIWRDIEVSKGVYQWGYLDGIVDYLYAQNIHLMIAVVKAPHWATPTKTDDGTPANPQDFADFLTALANRYKGKVAAYELWNEANLAAETGGRINAGFFVELVKAGYLALKAVDRKLVVVMGAISPTGHNDLNIAVDDLLYLEQIYQYKNGEVRAYFDVLGSHPYGMANPPDTLWSEGKPGPGNKFNTHDSFYFRRFEQQYAIMQKYGDGMKQVWLTEWGWGSDYQTDITKGYLEFNTVTEQMRAEYVTGAIVQMRQRNPYIGVTFLWNLNWSVVGNWYDGPSYYSIVNGDYSPRPVYGALKALPK